MSETTQNNEIPLPRYHDCGGDWRVFRTLGGDFAQCVLCDHQVKVIKRFGTWRIMKEGE